MHYMVKASIAGFQYIHHRITGDCHLLAQQRPALILETLRIIAKPVLDLAEAIDKRLLVSVLKQRNGFSKALIVALDQSQSCFRKT